MIPFSRAALIGAAILAFGLSANADPNLKFALTDIGVPPGSSGTVGVKVNNRGQVAGYAKGAGPDPSVPGPALQFRRPFLYSDGVLTLIPARGVALGINDSGAVVGQMWLSNRLHGFRFSGGVLTDLNPILGADLVAASGINASGQIVGWGRPLNDVSFSAYWISNGMAGVFPQPANAYVSTAYEVNSAGQAAGDLVFTNDAGGVLHHAHIFQYDRAIDLGALPGGTYSAARAINEAGHVVGWSGLDYRGPTNINATHATLYRDGLVLDLGALPGDLNSFAYDINNAGWVVGVSESILDGHTRAFLYANGTLHDLNDLLKNEPEWELSAANGVNDRGQIVGYGIRNGELRGFLLTPRHEPKPERIR